MTDPHGYLQQLRNADGVLLIVVHVDDFAIASSSDKMVAEFTQVMETVYVVTVTQNVHHFLDMHISQMNLVSCFSRTYYSSSSPSTPVLQNFASSLKCL
jgi:hypothetical protein